MIKKEFPRKEHKRPRSAYEAMQEISEALERVRFYEYVDQSQHPWRIVWKSFLSGIARGLGFVIGATVLIWALAWLFSRLGGLPAVGNFFASVAEMLLKGN